MRHYQYDSPQAAAHIVAVCLLADGHVSRLELETLEHHQISERLSLRPGELMSIVQATCEDLTSTAYLSWAEVSRIEPAIVRQLASSIRDRHLRVEIMQLCEACVRADQHISEGEAMVLQILSETWHLEPECDWVRHCDLSR
jgi:uncharacterized tellurite resistance protein B-like protein